MNDITNGVIILNKPKNKTSHDMVYACRRLFNTRRVGHTGTLDPNATGVLPICIGNATKAAEYITNSKKAYTAQLILGKKTDTLDCTGKVIKTSDKLCSKEELRRICEEFIGDITQIPPMYSAVKMGGKKLYELAREGKEVERKPRSVTIYSIKLDESDIDKGYVMLDVECSKGTYIRTLCDDIGQRAQCYAHMGELVRTYSGGFDISQSHTLEELEILKEEGRLSETVIKTDEIFSDYEKLYLDKKETTLVKNGVPLIKNGLLEGTFYRLYDEDGKFLCISEKMSDVLKMRTSFWT